MFVSYITSLLICLGAPRLVASALETLIFARWTLQESHRKFAIVYWTIFHTIAAFFMAQIYYRYMDVQPPIVAALLLVLSAGAYALVYIVPPYRTQKAMELVIIKQTIGEQQEEAASEQQMEATKNLYSLMYMRVRAGYAGLILFATLLILHKIVSIKNITQVGLDYLNNAVPWLYWGLVGIAAFFCLVSFVLVTMMLISDVRQRIERSHAENG